MSDPPTPRVSILETSHCTNSEHERVPNMKENNLRVCNPEAALLGDGVGEERIYSPQNSAAVHLRRGHSGEVRNPWKAGS